MAHSTLTPVFVGLRTGLHVLFAALLTLVVAGNGVYAATKWGINGWSESLRQELLPRIRVALIEPGVVDTELPTHTAHEQTKTSIDELYARATVTADDIAEVIAFTLARPRHLAINEILLRPADQA